MGDQSGSSHFHELFESAFQSYETNTGISLAKHPLAEQLQSCQSVEDITALVQGQASTFGELRGNDRIMKSIKSTVSILTTLSATASLGDTIGLVSQKGTDSVFHIPDVFLQPFHPVKAIYAGLAILLAVRALRYFPRDYPCDIHISDSHGHECQLRRNGRLARVDRILS